MTELEIGWAAGFFEGEGTFDGRGRPRVMQVDREPLERFRAITQMGRLYGPYLRVKANQQPVSHWAALGHGEALAVIALLMPHLSKRRQVQAEAARAKVLARKPYVTRTHCPKGHEYTQDNTYRDRRDGARSCRICRDQKAQAWNRDHPERRREIKAKHRLKVLAS